MFNPDCFKAVQQPISTCHVQALLQYLQQCNALAFLYNSIQHTPQYAGSLAAFALKRYYLALPQVHIHKRAHPLASVRNLRGREGYTLPKHKFLEIC